jgi:hypothetical protein
VFGSRRAKDTAISNLLLTRDYKGRLLFTVSRNALVGQCIVLSRAAEQLASPPPAGCSDCERLSLAGLWPSCHERIQIPDSLLMS